jgi:hypothetical protein
MSAYTDDNVVDVPNVASSHRLLETRADRRVTPTVDGDRQHTCIYTDGCVTPLAQKLCRLQVSRRCYTDGGRQHNVAPMVFGSVPTAKAVGVAPVSCSG